MSLLLSQTSGGGGGTVSGDLNATLDAVTLTAAAVVAITAAATMTLADVTLTGEGDVPINGAATVTLADVTLTGDVDVLIIGTTSISLDAVTVSGAAAVPISGSMTVDMDAVTVSGSAISVLTSNKVRRHYPSPEWNWPFVEPSAVLKPYAFDLLQIIVDAIEGVTGDGIRFIDMGFLRISIGTGSPNGVVVGSPPDVYLNLAGGAGTTLYLKESGESTDTGWAGV